MATNLEKKRAVVDKVSGMAKQASLALAVDYQTMTANQMNQLRKRAREDDVSVYVVKNTLARKALSETPYGCMADELSGPLALFFSNEEAAAAALFCATRSSRKRLTCFSYPEYVDTAYQANIASLI